MRPLASILLFAALTVFVAGCPERNNPSAVPAKGPDATGVAKMNGAPPVADANAPAGRKVYDAHRCSKCHRIDDGSPPRGKAPSLAHVGAKHSADCIAEHVRNPKAHSGKMRAYPESEIANDDLKTLSEYLASLK